MSDSATETYYYYLNSDQQPVGPMGLGAIQKLVDADVVDGEVLVCPAGEENWKPLKTLSKTAQGAVGPPLTPPPPRSADFSTRWSRIPVWLAPAALGVGIVSVLAASLPFLAFLLAIPALIGGIVILRQPAAPKRGLALAAVVSGSLGTLPALGFVVGMFLAELNPEGSFSLFGPSVEDQVVGSWIAGTEIQYGPAMMGYRVLAEFDGNSNCTIMWGMGFGSAQSGDPRGADFGTKASGRWELAKSDETIVVKMGENPEFEMQGNNGERSFTARGRSDERSGGEVETWEFKIRKHGGDIELFCYPPGFNRGYSFTRLR